MTYEEVQDLLRQAAAAETQGIYDEAERLSQQILVSLTSKGIAEQADTELTTLRAEATRMLGVVCRRRGVYPQALEHMHTSLQASQQIDDQAGIASALCNIGNVYVDLSDYPKALEYYGKALSLCEELGNKSGGAALLGNIGAVHHNLSDYPKALDYYGRALSLVEELGNRSAVAQNLGNIGVVYSNLSDYPKALEYYVNALSLVEELGSKSGEATNLGNIGLVHMNLSDYPKAMEYYIKALNLDQELGNRQGVAMHLGNIGIVYGQLSDYPKALEYFVKALSLAEELGNKSGVALWLGNIGYAQYNLSDYPKALEYCGKALSLDEELGNKSGVARHLGNIGLVRMKLCDYVNAQEYLERGMSLHDELGQKSEVGGIKGSLGELYMSNANPYRDETKAEAYLLESIAVVEGLGTKQYDAHKTLADLYEKQKRWEESHYHLGKYFRLKEEVQNEEAKKSAVLMEQKREIAEREKQLSVERAEARATQNVLHQVLPASIADRLVKGEKVADYFQHVSILFADIVGFTPIASRMPAKAVLAFLNYVFGEFDRMVAACGCEKIKTIGDGYLAVAGAPVSCEDHAERIARLALEMSKDIILPEEIRKTLPKGAQFSLRIGIHTGPCFGGIVGENRFVYDIYSDAVNLAARMESHGEAGKIHVSDEFCFHLQNRMDATGEDFGGIRFDEREEMEIKGKGMMRTYFLEKE